MLAAAPIPAASVTGIIRLEHGFPQCVKFSINEGHVLLKTPILVFLLSLSFWNFL